MNLNAARFPDWKTLAPVILAPVILFAPLLASGQALYWGTPFLQFTPWRFFAWQTLSQGHLPLWDPWVGMGAPLAANYQSALFYPPNWLLIPFVAWGGAAGLAWGQTLLVALHLIWAGIGMAWLVRRLGLGSLAQTVAGLAFSLCGYLVARAGFFSINAAAAWLPWILLFSDVAAPYGIFRRVERPQGNFLLRSVPLTVCMAMQLLAGHAQTTWYTLLLLCVWVMFWGWLDGGWRRTGFALLRLLAPLLLAIGLAAVQLLPTAEYLLQSQRASAVDYSTVMNYSFWPWRLLTLLAPDFFGNPAQGNYWVTADNYWEDAVYIGVLPFIMALAAVLRRRPRSEHGEKDTTVGNLRPLVWLLVAVVLISFLLALGRYTPLFPFLYRWVPTFDLFQAPARWTLWAEFALVILAAIGVETWRQPAGRGLYWARLGTMGAFAVTVGAGLGWFLLRDLELTYVRATAIAGFWALGVGFLTLLAPQPDAERPAAAWHWGVALWVAGDLLLAGWGLNPGASLELYRPASQNAANVRSLAAGERLYIPSDDIQNLMYQRFFRFESFLPSEPLANLREVFLPDANLLDGVSEVNNFEPLLPGRYTRWMDQLDRLADPVRDAMLAFMDAGVIERVDPSSASGVSFQTIPRASRVYWFTCAHPAKGEMDAWGQVNAKYHRDGSVDPWVVLEGEISPEVNCTSTKQTYFRIIGEYPGRIVLEGNATSTGYLMLSDVWYPGWKAQIDGRAAPILRADYLFQAILVSPGTHQITFEYRPLSYILGIWITFAAMLGLVVITTWSRIRQRFNWIRPGFATPDVDDKPRQSV
jgi:hypothetical protein